MIIAPKAQPKEDLPDPLFVAMAAAQMHEQGRLVEPEPKPEPEKPR